MDHDDYATLTLETPTGPLHAIHPTPKRFRGLRRLYGLTCTLGWILRRDLAEITRNQDAWEDASIALSMTPEERDWTMRSAEELEARS